MGLFQGWRLVFVGTPLSSRPVGREGITGEAVQFAVQI
jgi:hypothetical protein